MCDIVELIIEPKNPHNYFTPDFFSNWGTPLVLSILGVVFTAIGAWGYACQRSHDDGDQQLLEQHGAGAR